MTDQPHREWIYRQAYQMGRHIIGYEVQKVLAAVDWFTHANTGRAKKIGVAGYCEGGLIAFYAAACRSAHRRALVSGYFDSRQQIWSEPIYRNLFGILREFGDAEIATLIAPSRLIIEYSRIPDITSPRGDLKTPKLRKRQRLNIDRIDCAVKRWLSDQETRQRSPAGRRRDRDRQKLSRPLPGRLGCSH